MMIISSGALLTREAGEGPVEATYNTFGFDGSTEYVDFGNDASIQLTDNFTVCAWVETSSLDSDDSVFGKWNSTGNQRSYFFQERSDGRFRFVVSKDGGATTYAAIGSTSSISSNTEYFVCCTVEGTTLKIFVDGAEYASDTSLPSAGIHNSTENLVLGGSSSSSVDYEGSAANFFVFDSVLSDSEILSLHNSGKIPYYETLPSNYTDNCVLASELSSRDATANDLSGNGNNGTKNGGISADGALQTFASYGQDATYNTFGFDGSTEYVTLDPAKSPFKGKSTLSIVTWVRFGSIGAGQRIINDNLAGASYTNANFGVNSSGKLQFFYRSVDGGTGYTSTGSTVLSTNTWYMLSMSLDVNDSCKLYIDGVDDTDVSSVSGSAISSTTPSYSDIGRDGRADSSYLNGSTTSIMATDDILSSSEMVGLYNLGKVPYYETLPSSITSNSTFFIEMSSRDNTLEDKVGTNDGTANGGISADGSTQTFASYS